jgi:hypothetical protein
MLGGKGKGGRVGQRESPSGTEVSPCLRVANLQKIFFICIFAAQSRGHEFEHVSVARARASVARACVLCAQMQIWHGTDA